MTALSMKERLARDLRAQIDSGQLRAGEALPSTRELADRWGVSVFTVSGALKILAGEGLVKVRPRSGALVTAGPTRPIRESVSPHVVLIGGYAGSGKSELGRILSKLTGWPIIDKDTITRPVVELALEALGQPHSDRESRTYIEQVRPQEYEALMDATFENATCGLGVIATAPFTLELSNLDWITRVQSQLEDVPLALIWVRCDHESMLTYIRRRGVARDTGKLNNWEKYIKSLDMDFEPRSDHMIVNNSVNAEPLLDQARQVLKRLRERAE